MSGEQSLSHKFNKNFLAVPAALSFALGVTACGDNENPTATYSGEGTRIASPTPANGETSTAKATHSETTKPTAETHVAKDYNTIVSKSVPDTISYQEALPKMSPEVKAMNEMTADEFSKRNLNQILEYKDFVMPDKAGSVNVVGKWTETTDSLPYKTPNKNMKSIDILDNFQAEANFIQHKVGEGTSLDTNMAAKLTASQFYFDGFYDTGTYKNYSESAEYFNTINTQVRDTDGPLTGSKARMLFNQHIAAKDVPDTEDTTMVNGKEVPSRVVKAQYTNSRGDKTNYEIALAYYDGQWLAKSWVQDDPFNWEQNDSTIQSNDQYFK